jgi:hypothetical protein
VVSFTPLPLHHFDNRVPKKIFGPKSDEAIGGWRKLHNKGLHNLYTSPSTIRMIEWRMRWEGNVARMGRRGMHIGYWWEKQQERTTRKTNTYVGR